MKTSKKNRRQSVNEEFSAVNLFGEPDQDDPMTLSWLIYLCKSLIG